MTGKTISHYKIVEQIGCGGMGVVYRAEDTKLKRIVALKFLPPDLTRNPEAKARLIREAQAASILQHENICTIHEIGETADGDVFICMDYYEGETLADKLSVRETAESVPLPETETLDFAVQTAQGLAIAHEKGIIHRDIKPANLMVTKDGLVKILDFGLAKYSGKARLTQTGKAAGTVFYLSPEQASGKKVDHRTDIWSLGVVLYESVTGKRPFENDCDAAVIYSIIDKSPPYPSRAGVPVSDDLERIILKCLQKNPDDRYQTARELISDLQEAGNASEHGDPGVIPGRKSRLGGIRNRRPGIAFKRPLVLGFSLMLVLGFFFLAKGLFFKKDHKIQSIAVMPFENLSSDKEQEYFVSGIHEELLTDLSKFKALKIISRTSVMRYDKTGKTSTEIAEGLHVDALVEGSVLRIADQVRINVQLIDGSSDKHLWAETYDRNLLDVFPMLSEVAQAIAGEIQIAVTRQDRELLSPPHFIKPEVQEEYLKGRYLFLQLAPEERRNALAHFSKSVELDPHFAPGYAGQASVYFLMGFFGASPFPEVLPKARALALKAIEMDEGLGEAHSVLGWIRLCYDWDWDGAASELRRALDLNPNDVIARHAYGDYLMIMGNPEEALHQVELAREVDPLSPIAVMPYIFHLQFVHRYDQMIEECRKLLATDTNYPSARANLRDALWFKGDTEKAFEEYRKTWGLDERWKNALNRGYRKAGPRGGLRELAGAVARQNQSQTGASLKIAELYALSGDRENALVWLQKAVQERTPFLIHIQASPTYDTLRGDPRFQSLLKHIGFPNREKESVHG